MRESVAFPQSDPDEDASNVASMMAEWLEQCASFRIAVRDGEGRFVRTGTVGERDPAFFSEEERRGLLGATDWPTMRYLDADGRELRRLDHPAHVARLTGQPQIGKFIGLRAPSGETKWYFGDYIPMRPSEAGYEVISVIMEVTQARLAHRRMAVRATALGVLLDAATRLISAPASLDALAAELRDAFDAVAPRTHGAITVWDASARTMRGCMVTELPGMLPVATTTLSSQEVRTFLASTHVNNDLQLTDIYGTRVIGADEVPARSVCVTPVTSDGRLVGAVSTYSQSAGYFGEERVGLLERLAQVVAPALTAIAEGGRRGGGESTRSGFSPS